MREENFDLVVAGGGPGGSTVATLVAMRGFSVLLLEKEHFPRYQIGESLLPATIQGICSLLGVKEEVDKAGFMPKKGGTFRWGKAPEPWTFYFDRPVNGAEPRATAYQVERARFDDILLKNAAAKGVTVREGCRVEEVIHGGNDEDRVTGVIYQNESGDSCRVNARYLADASGNGSTICAEVGERIYSDEFNNIAVYTYFDNARRLPAPNNGNILTCAFEDGWFWFIPLSETLTSVGVVLDRKVLRSGKNIEELYTESIAKTPLIKSYLEGATRRQDELYGKLRVRRDYSYTSTRLWKPGMVLIGDSACFIDPVFSSGVHLATYSGLCAARSINSFFQGSFTEEQCFDEFEKRYRIEFGNFYNFLLAFYDTDQDKDNYFWNARKVLGTKETASEAFVRLIAGYSTEGIPETEDINDFFRLREGIGRQIIEKELMGNDIAGDGREAFIDGGRFMDGFTSEVKNLQAHAHGFNLGKNNANPNFNYTATDDFLGWAEYGN